MLHAGYYTCYQNTTLRYKSIKINETKLILSYTEEFIQKNIMHISTISLYVYIYKKTIKTSYVHNI